MADDQPLCRSAKPNDRVHPMPQLSKRITTLNDTDSDGWDVFYRARRLKMSGAEVTELTIGEHDIGTDPAILNFMHEAALSGHTGYAMVPGTDTLRDTVAARVSQRTGIPTDRDNVMITPGGQAALFAAHMAALQPGEAGLYIEPYYATYPGSIRGTGAVAHALQTRAEDDFFPDAAALDALAKRTQARSVLINTPNNPTGAVYPRAVLEEIADVAQRRDLWVISDEVYDTQIWSGTHISLRSLPDMGHRTLVVGSMSKSHAMTGSRVGWVVGPHDAIAAMIDLATSTTYGVPGYIQDAAVFALEQGTGPEAIVAAPFRRRRHLAHDILQQQDVVGLIPSGGAMYLFLDIRATGMTGEGFANALLDTHSIGVMPGESFGASAAGHIRVAMTVDDDAFAKALTLICTFASHIESQAS
jgi:arginine:pyruvate transaminase